ncbi:hypothetical protein PV04_01628 [Phialophora macrospora]|uniref:Uncharacterized protein n=1 Tax=Phialophora macrospora TaxID=1851006 RepID=A0A0D2G432_9EURO|nr:hypothetical protein PV04_01628 [Phialophora macrospora]
MKRIVALEAQNQRMMELIKNSSTEQVKMTQSWAQVIANAPTANQVLGHHTGVTTVPARTKTAPLTSFSPVVLWPKINLSANRTPWSTGRITSPSAPPSRLTCPRCLKARIGNGFERSWLVRWELFLKV